MSPLKDNFVSATTYNSLPHIRDVADVPKANSDDLEVLRALLSKHNVPAGVRVRLIHKHFNAVDGEVMVFKEVTVPPHGTVQFMGPMVPAQAPQLRGIHYLVDKEGQLQSYEYTVSEGPDMSKYDAFFNEFCHIVVERGLQRKLGLKLGLDTDKAGWTEFEFQDRRGTIIIPQGVPLPEGEYDINVVTEWPAKHGDTPTGGQCTHCYHCSHCSHCSHGLHFKNLDDTELYLGGKKLEPGSPVHSIVVAVRKEV